MVLDLTSKLDSMIGMCFIMTPQPLGSNLYGLEFQTSGRFWYLRSDLVSEPIWLSGWFHGHWHPTACTEPRANWVWTCLWLSTFSCTPGVPRYQSQCVFPYWVRLETSLFESITTPRCLQSQPQWMMDNRDLFGDLQLGELMMVASHDAASYRWSSSKNRRKIKPASLMMNDFLIRQFEGDMLDNFITAIIFTQEEDLGAQLQYGSRLLDIRIGHCK